MTIIQVKYEVLISLGNYNNERIGLVKQVNPKDDIQAVVQELRELAKECGLPQLSKLYDEYYTRQEAVRVLNKQIEEKTAQWEQIAEFLRAQGIRPDAPQMPKALKALSASVELEEVELVEADTIDDIPM